MDPKAIDLADRSFNAGAAAVPSDLTLTRQVAQARAQALGQPVDIYQHVGGLNPAKARAVVATGHYLWRDRLDQDGQALPAPRWYRFVETVEHG